MAADFLPAGDQRELLLRIYSRIGLVVLHWTRVLTVALGCIVVMVMKGPGFVAGAYPPPGCEPVTSPLLNGHDSPTPPHAPNASAQ